MKALQKKVNFEAKMRRIKKMSRRDRKTGEKKSDQEFKKWWKMFLKEHSAALDELARC